MHKIRISKLLFEYISLLPAQQTLIPFLVSIGHLHIGAANPKAAPANAALGARGSVVRCPHSASSAEVAHSVVVQCQNIFNDRYELSDSVPISEPPHRVCVCV